MNEIQKAFADLQTNAWAFWALSRVHAMPQDGRQHSPETTEATESTRIEIENAIKILKPIIESNTHVTLETKLLGILESEKRTSEIIDALTDVHPVSVKRAIKNAVETGNIEKVKHGVYRKVSK